MRSVFTVVYLLQFSLLISSIFLMIVHICFSQVLFFLKLELCLALA